MPRFWNADRPPGLVAAALAAVVGLLGAGGCDRTAAPSSAGATSAAPATSASAAAASVAPPPAVDAAPRGAGVTEFAPLAELAECKAKVGDVAVYLQRQGIGLAGRADGSFAAVWMVELQKRDAQIAFAGFDSEARQVARGRAVGATREEGLRIFSAGEAWTVTWFDSEGLAFSQPRWEANPPPGIQHLGAVGKEISDNVAIAAAPGGSLVAATPFGAERNQLGVFLFAPADPAQPSVKALGVTHHAMQPRGPAVAADSSGYLVAWHEPDGSIKASRFDVAGKEGDAHVIAPAYGSAGSPGAAAPTGAGRERLGLVAAGAGALAIWVEGGALIARSLDAAARPRAAPWVIGKGKWRALAPSGDGALVAWIGHDGKADAQVLLVRLSAEGAPAAKGFRVSDGVNPVKEPPSLARAGARGGVAWTEAMGPGVSTKRAVLRVLERSCIP
jgi:hypothetical protein